MYLSLSVFHHPGLYHGSHSIGPVLSSRTVVHRPGLQTVQLVDPAVDRNEGDKMKDVVIFISFLGVKLEEGLSSE